MAFDADELASVVKSPTSDVVRRMADEMTRQQRALDRIRQVLARWRELDRPLVERSGQLSQAMLAARADELEQALGAAAGTQQHPTDAANRA